MSEHAYKVYEIGEDGHILSRRELLDCMDHRLARSWAQQLVDGRIIELWDGVSLIGRYEPKRPE